LGLDLGLVVVEVEVVAQVGILGWAQIKNKSEIVLKSALILVDISSVVFGGFFQLFHEFWRLYFSAGAKVGRCRPKVA
jgi:hypothetical protein